jgi:WD40 repeat protein
MGGLIDLTADGRTLLTCDLNTFVRTWDVSDPGHPRLLRVYRHSLGESVWWVGISPDGERVAAGGEKGLVLWSANGGEPIRLGQENVFSFTFSPDSRFLTWASNGRNELCVRDLETSRERPLPLREPDTGHTAYFPDGSRLARMNRSHKITILDSMTGEQLDELGPVDFSGQGSFFMGRKPALSGDGEWVAVQAPAIPVWDVSTKKPLFTLPAAQSLPTDPAWGAGRELLGVGYKDGSVYVWNIPLLRDQLRRIGLDW